MKLHEALAWLFSGDWLSKQTTAAVHRSVVDAARRIEERLDAVESNQPPRLKMLCDLRDRIEALEKAIAYVGHLYRNPPAPKPVDPEKCCACGRPLSDHDLSGPPNSILRCPEPIAQYVPEPKSQEPRRGSMPVFNGYMHENVPAVEVTPDVERRLNAREERLDILEGDANHEANVIGEFRKRIEALEGAYPKLFELLGKVEQANIDIKEILTPKPKPQEPKLVFLCRGVDGMLHSGGTVAASKPYVERTPDVERRLKAREERQHSMVGDLWYLCPKGNCMGWGFHRTVYVVEEEKP